MDLEVTFLGTGTSHGVPMIGCDCDVCTSSDQRNKRTRTSSLVKVGESHLLIDTTPELRLQALANNVRRVNAVLFTHAHADHIFGLDDVRRFNEMQGGEMPCYGSPETLDTIRKAFNYVFIPTQMGGGKPQLKLIEVNAPFEVAGVPVIPVPVLHGRILVYGYRIGSFGYVTDCSDIPESSRRLLMGLDTLVLGALRPNPHPTHLSLEQAVEMVDTLKPGRALFVHMTHRLDHEKTNAILPEHIRLAYDGLKIEVPDAF